MTINRGTWTVEAGVQLRAERAAVKMGRQEVAVQVPFSAKAIQYYEEGRRSPSIETIGALCEVYDLPVEVFIARVAERVRARR